MLPHSAPSSAQLSGTQLCPPCPPEPLDAEVVAVVGVPPAPLELLVVNDSSTQAVRREPRRTSAVYLSIDEALSAEAAVRCSCRGCVSPRAPSHSCSRASRDGMLPGMRPARPPRLPHATQRCDPPLVEEPCDPTCVLLSLDFSRRRCGARPRMPQ